MCRVFVEAEQSFDATGEGIERPIDRAGADIVRASVAAVLAPGVAAAVGGEGRRGLSRPAAQDQQNGCDQPSRFGMPTDCGPPSEAGWGRKPRRVFQEAVGEDTVGRGGFGGRFHGHSHFGIVVLLGIGPTDPERLEELRRPE